MHQHTHTEQMFPSCGTQWIIPTWISLCPTGTTHICRSAQASGSPRTNSTSMTPNCCSSALLPNNHSAWTLEEEDERATSTSSPTSSTLCSTSSTRTHLFWCNICLTTEMTQLIFNLYQVMMCRDDTDHKSVYLTNIQLVLLMYFSLSSHFALQTFSAVQGLHLGRRRTCRVSRSSHVRNGWRARTRLKDRTILPSWPCTSCRLNAGGLHEYTSYEDS